MYGDIVGRTLLVEPLSRIAVLLRKPQGMFYICYYSLFSNWSSIDDSTGNLIRSVIIPKIAELRHSDELNINLCITTGLPDCPTLAFEDILEVDKFLGLIATKCVFFYSVKKTCLIFT